MDQVQHYRGVLEQATKALQLASQLLDEAYGKPWRREWPVIQEALLACKLEANGWNSFEDAEAEAERRTKETGVEWRPFFAPDGALIVLSEEV